MHVDYLFYILRAHVLISPSSQAPFNMIEKKQKRYKPTIRKEWGGCEQMRDFNTFLEDREQKEGW